MPDCTVLKHISNVILMACGVGFVALGGYYLNLFLVGLHDLEDIMSLLMNALQIVMNNFLMIFLWVACLTKLRSLFLNCAMMCGGSFIVTLANCILSALLKSTCDAQEIGNQSIICQMFGNFAWLGPTIVTFVLNGVTMTFAMIRYAFYNAWDWGY